MSPKPSRFAAAIEAVAAALSVGVVAVLSALLGIGSITAGVALLFGPGWSLIFAGMPLVGLGWLLSRGMSRA